MRAREAIVARTAALTLLGGAAQPIGALALAIGARELGGPSWAPYVFLPFSVASAVYLLRERALHRAPRPGSFFVMMCAGVSIAVVAGGLLESPVLFALGTLPVGSAALGPSLAYARRIQVWMLGLLVFAVAGDLAGLSIAEAQPYVDRAVRGAGFYIGTALSFGVISTGVALGGLASRQIYAAIEETEAIAALARSEHLASLEARTRDVVLLAGSLAEELSGPLRALRERAAVIEARAEQPAVGERLRVMIAELERVERRLVHHQTFARPTGAFERVSTTELLGTLARAAEGLATARGVDVLAEAGDDLELETDREKLIEVLENLLQNAIEASPRGGRVTLAAARTPGEGASASVELTVVDAGPGLGAAAGAMFTPGFTTKPRGSGLGLVLSRDLAVQLGGTLDLADRTDGPSGARAVVRLPRSKRSA